MMTTQVDHWRQCIVFACNYIQLGLVKVIVVYAAVDDVEVVRKCLQTKTSDKPEN